MNLEIKPYLEKFKFLFLNPVDFFTSVRKENDYMSILKFYVGFSVAVSIIIALLNIPLMFKDSVYIMGSILGIVTAIVFSFVSPFIASGIIHLGVIIFKGKNGFFNTFKPVTYAMTIGVAYTLISSVITGVYSWFKPITDIDVSNVALAAQDSAFITVISIVIGLASLVHVLIAHVKGISFYQGMTTMKAFLATVLVPFVLFILFAVIIGTGIGFFSTMFGM
jgi:hypothetical protein